MAELKLEVPDSTFAWLINQNFSEDAAEILIKNVQNKCCPHLPSSRRLLAPPIMRAQSITDRWRFSPGVSRLLEGADALTGKAYSEQIFDRRLLSGTPFVRLAKSSRNPRKPDIPESRRTNSRLVSRRASILSRFVRVGRPHSDAGREDLDDDPCARDRTPPGRRPHRPRPGFARR